MGILEFVNCVIVA